MTHALRIGALSAAVIAFTLLSAAVVFAHGSGHDHSHGPIKLEEAFSRASASPMVQVGAAYLKITNTGDADDRLIAAEGDAAERLELHTHLMEDGAMRMMEIDGGVPIPAGETVVFEPGAKHIMLIGLTDPLVEGETLTLDLVFENAGRMTLDIPILGVGAMEGGMDHSHDHSGHGTE
jgi:copper(I)-binding protein